MKTFYTLLTSISLLFTVEIFAQTPIAWYPLNGNAQDASGNTFNGTISGNPTAASSRFSQTGQAMNFDGTGDKIVLPLSADFPSRTVIVWFNAAVIGGGQLDGVNVIYGSDFATLQNGLTLMCTIDDAILGNVAHFECDQYKFKIPVNTNQWYQMAITRNPSEIKYYLNGVLVFDTINPSGVHSFDGVSQTTIGTNRNYVSSFIGKIDDVLIFNSVLPDVYILNNYNAWLDSIVQVTGKLFFDVNQNQVFDSTDQPIRNQLINVGSGNSAITNASGNYIAWTLPGTFTIRPVLSGDLIAFPLSPDSIVLAADSVGVTYPDNNFSLTVPGNFCEGSVAVVAITPPPRPGFTNRVDVRFVNALSAIPVSQTIQFTYPPQQEYVSATPAPASVDTNNHIVTWNLSNIPSGTLWLGTVTLRTPVLVAMGSIFEMSALVSNSTCASIDSLQTGEEVIVVGSFDPNDKAVSPVGQEPGGRILPSTSVLNYTIRFQNTGTFLAENVNIIDTISNLLDISTLRVEAASHGYEVIINGRVVTFRFSEIMLPDSNANEPMSHGYIKYSIKPASGFVQGSVVENFADIYFDFNAPIRTNTTQSTADISIGMLADKSDVHFKVYPNPLLSGNWRLTADKELVGKEVKVYDVAGRAVYSALITQQYSEIDASHLQNGVYFAKVGRSVVRLIKF